MNRREMKRELKSLIPDMEIVQSFMSDDPYKSVYLGSFMSLDPCGRYHHAISPNGVTNRCMAYWKRLDRAAYEAGGWIESGEGDPTDVFFCMPIPENEKDK
jgi:hypothetical protein